MTERVHVYTHKWHPIRALFLLIIGFMIGGEVVSHHVGPAAPTAEQVRAYCLGHDTPGKAPVLPMPLLPGHGAR